MDKPAGAAVGAIYLKSKNFSAILLIGVEMFDGDHPPPTLHHLPHLLFLLTTVYIPYTGVESA